MKQSGFHSCAFCKELSNNSAINASVVCFPYHEDFLELTTNGSLHTKEEYKKDACYATTLHIEVTFFLKKNKMM